MYRAVPVHPALAGVVLGIAAYAETSPVRVRRRQSPVGSCTLILGIGGALRLDGPDGTSAPTAFLAGLHDSTVTTSFVGHQAGVQVDLTPLGLLRLLPLAPADLAGRVPDLDALGVGELARLPARIAEDVSWDARLARVQDTLQRLLSCSTAAPDPEVAWAWRRLERARGRVPVSVLADEVGWSRRHLLTRFRAQVGLAPTPVGRILRFRHAADLLLPGAGPGRRPADARIADVAAAAGYSDHAHLVREFRALAGCTPSAYVGGFPDVQDLDDAPP